MRERARRAVTLTAGAIAALALVALGGWHLRPFRGGHEGLAPIPLVAMVGAFVFDHLARRVRPGELVRAGILAVGFLLWAATMLWPELPQAMLLNDLAIGLFVLDLFLGLMRR